jgi:multidrug resistance efflux pump
MKMKIQAKTLPFNCLPSSHRSHTQITLILAALLLLSLLACQSQEDEFALYLKAHSKPHQVYETHAIEKAIAVETVTLPAIISIPPEKQKWLHLPMDGQILNWQIKQGDLIKTGATLAELRLSEMLDLEANLKQIQNQINQQTQYVELIKRQRKSGVADERQLQEAQLTLASLQNQSNALNQQKSGRNRLGIKGGGQQWTWSSPYSGRVSEISCASGAMLSPQDRCVRLVDENSLWIETQLPQRLVDQLDALYQAQFWPKSSNQSIDLEFMRRAVEINQGQGTITVYFKPKDQSQAIHLLSNQGGKVRIDIKAPDDTYELPRQALTLIDGVPCVFVEDEAQAQTQAQTQAQSQAQETQLNSKNDLPPLKLVQVDLVGEIDQKIIVHSKQLQSGMKVFDRGVFSIKTHYLLHREDAP